MYCVYHKITYRKIEIDCPLCEILEVINNDELSELSKLVVIASISHPQNPSPDDFAWATQVLTQDMEIEAVKAEVEKKR